MANQLFTPNLAEISKPLRDLLSKNAQWCWNQPQQNAFDGIKQTLVSSPVLALYDPNTTGRD